MPTPTFTNRVTLERVVKSLPHLDFAIDISDTSADDAVIRSPSSVSTLESFSESYEGNFFDIDYQLIAPARVSGVEDEADKEADDGADVGEDYETDDLAHDEADDEAEYEAEYEADSAAAMQSPSPISSSAKSSSEALT